MFGSSALLGMAVYEGHVYCHANWILWLMLLAPFVAVFLIERSPIRSKVLRGLLAGVGLGLGVMVCSRALYLVTRFEIPPWNWTSVQLTCWIALGFGLFTAALTAIVERPLEVWLRPTAGEIG